MLPGILRYRCSRRCHPRDAGYSKAAQSCEGQNLDLHTQLQMYHIRSTYNIFSWILLAGKFISYTHGSGLTSKLFYGHFNA